MVWHSATSLVVFKAIEKWKAEYIEMHIDLDGKGFEYKSRAIVDATYDKRINKFC